MSDPEKPTSDTPAPATPSPLPEQIAVFVAAAVLSGFAIRMFEASLLPVFAKTRADIGDAMTVLPFAAHMVALVIWIALYTVFPNVPVRRAIPWLWAVGGLHVAASILLTAQDLARFNLQPPVGYYISVTGGMVALILVFRAWFIRKGRIAPDA